MVLTDKYRQLLEEGHKQWGMLSDADCSILLQADLMSTLMDSQASSRGSFCQPGSGCPQDSRCKVNWAEVDGTVSSATATMEETISSEDMDTDLVDDVCEQSGIDMETLYVQMASHRHKMARANTEANKQHHKHWKPPKGSGLPALDVCRMMAAKADIDVNGIKYSIKKASTVGQPTNVSIDGVTYSVSIALSTYHVSASRRSASGSLVNRGANGGIVGDDCHLIKEMTCFVNTKGIDDHVMEW